MQTEIRGQLLRQLQSLDTSRDAFEPLALAIFRYQAQYNNVYQRFLNLIGRNPDQISKVTDIPALPIALFKNYEIVTGQWLPETVFTSSGTSGQVPSRHLVKNLDFYLQNTIRGFQPAFGNPKDWVILALLPGYLERTGSSLIAMAHYFIQMSQFEESGFFLNNFEELNRTLTQLKTKNNVLLLGVSFALLDFGAQFPMDLPKITIMETGGMKGRKKEMTRAALHNELRAMFGTEKIYSEYGMTEMFSQAYTTGSELFSPAPTLRMYTTEITDPLSPTLPERSGILNIIDLANIDTCSFIATEDIGRVMDNGRFTVLGRLDAAEMRGCNLMAPQNGSFE